LTSLNFFISAHPPGFCQQLRSALSRLNNDCPLLPWLFPANTLDLPLATLAQKVKTDAVFLPGLDQMIKPIFQPQKIHFVEFTLEDAELHPLPEVFERFKDAPAAFVIRDIVRNYNKHISLSLLQRREF